MQSRHLIKGQLAYNDILHNTPGLGTDILLNNAN